MRQACTALRALAAAWRSTRHRPLGTVRQRCGWRPPRDQEGLSRLRLCLCWKSERDRCVLRQLTTHRSQSLKLPRIKGGSQDRSCLIVRAALRRCLGERLIAAQDVHISDQTRGILEATLARNQVRNVAADPVRRTGGSFGSGYGLPKCHLGILEMPEPGQCGAERGEHRGVVSRYQLRSATTQKLAGATNNLVEVAL
jgi:hypothetical protein